jgi:hypothetical protein
MSKKWMSCFYQNLQQDPIKKPSELPTTATVTVQQLSGGVTFL